METEKLFTLEILCLQRTSLARRHLVLQAGLQWPRDLCSVVVYASFCVSGFGRLCSQDKSRRLPGKKLEWQGLLTVEAANTSTGGVGLGRRLLRQGASLNCLGFGSHCCESILHLEMRLLRWPFLKPCQVHTTCFTPTARLSARALHLNVSY